MLIGLSGSVLRSACGQGTDRGGDVFRIGVLSYIGNCIGRTDGSAVRVRRGSSGAGTSQVRVGIGRNPRPGVLDAVNVENGAIDGAGVAVFVGVDAREDRDVLGRFIGVGRSDFPVADGVLHEPV